MRLLAHRSVFPAALAVRAQTPRADQTQGGEKPEDDRGKTSERESREAEDNEENGKCGEKEVHGREELAAGAAHGRSLVALEISVR
jgi:hypothetical protein